MDELLIGTLLASTLRVATPLILCALASTLSERAGVIDLGLEGKMLLAATDKGICRLSFDEDEGELHRRFPEANIEQGGATLARLVKGAVAAVNKPAQMPNLPLDIQGTAFQQAVWRELTRIPPGETRTYTQLAMAAGNPGAVRAAGTACGQNRVAVLIPCHRALRTDGSLGGYAYGLERKMKLLEMEEAR